MSPKRDAASVVGVGAIACAACCAGPIVGVLTAIGLSGVVGFAVFGLLGVAAAFGIGAVGFLMKRRRRPDVTHNRRRMVHGACGVQASMRRRATVKGRLAG